MYSKVPSVTLGSDAVFIGMFESTVQTIWHRGDH
jgi:hypothetical protein